MRVGVRQVHPAVELILEFALRFAPQRVVDHDLPRTGRVAKFDQRFREARAGVFQIGVVEAVAQNQRVVLVGLDDLFATAFAAHHDQAAVFHQLFRGDQLPGAGKQLGVQRLHQPRQLRGFHAVAGQHAHQPVDLCGHALQGVQRVGQLDLLGNQVRVVGEIRQQVDLLQHANGLAVFGDHHALDIVAGHGQQGVEQIVARVGGHQIEVRGVGQCGAGRGTGEDDVAKIAGGKNADAFARAHQNGLGAVALHRLGGVQHGLCAIEKHRGFHTGFAHGGGEQGLQLAVARALGHGGEFFGHALEEKRAKHRVGFDQPHHQFFGQREHQGFFVHFKTVDGLPGNQRAGVEGVVAVVDGDDFAIVGDFADNALDHHIQGIHRLAGGEDDVFVGVEHDINRFFHLVALTGGQHVKWGMQKIKAAHACSPTLSTNVNHNAYVMICTCWQ